MLFILMMLFIGLVASIPTLNITSIRGERQPSESSDILYGDLVTVTYFVGNGSLTSVTLLAGTVELANVTAAEITGQNSIQLNFKAGPGDVYVWLAGYSKEDSLLVKSQTVKVRVDPLRAPAQSMNFTFQTYNFETPEMTFNSLYVTGYLTEADQQNTQALTSRHGKKKGRKYME
jgi:hypothetical protein